MGIIRIVVGVICRKLPWEAQKDLGEETEDVEDEWLDEIESRGRRSVEG